MQSPISMATDDSYGEEEEKPTVSSFITGLTIPEQIYNATTSLQQARQDGFDYVVTALPNTVPLLTTLSSGNGVSNSGGVAKGNGIANHNDGASNCRTDVTRLESKWWSTAVVGMVVDPPQWNTKQQTKSKPQSSSTSSYDNLQGIKLRDALTSTSSTDIDKKVEATKIFWGMLEWSAHMNIPAVILPSVPLVEKKIKSSDIHSSDEEDMFAEEDQPQCPSDSPEKKTKLSINSPQSKEYARLISNLSTSSICTSSHVQLWIRVPLSLNSIQAYQLLLSKCNYSSSVGCMICVSDTTPINNPTDLSAIIVALHGLIGSGHVKAISWNMDIFMMNKKGYPTLSKSHQYIFSFVYGRLGRTLRTLLEGSLTAANSNNNVNMNAGSSLRLHHLQYLRHLRSKSNLLHKLDNQEAILETPYLDNLQSPLQPLGDHLEYQTYETFEKDPVKYRNYGLAVEYALLDGLEENKFSSSSVVSSNVDLYEVTILVVGAGRGPLVRESISAVSRVSASLNDAKVVGMQQRKKGLHAKIIAIEKNPSAVLYLQSLKGSDPSWNGGRDYNPYSSDEGSINKIVLGTSNVSVIGCDMREANSHPILKDMIDNVKSRGDIVVSELLGSFGDNELSPECLDGVQQCGILKDDCVSIPQNYTAFIVPVSSARLYCEAKNQSCFPLNTNEGPASPSVGMQRALETPYVVRSHAASQTHAEQACWTYTHPHQSKTEGTTSSQAAMNINNDRHAHLSFQRDPTHGVGFGCGYGALDSEVSSIVSSASDSDDTTITLHGLLGSFHSVLYESKKRNDISTISISTLR